MGRTILFPLRLKTARDVPLGMRLKEQAGWNQTEAPEHRQGAGLILRQHVARLAGAPVRVGPAAGDGGRAVVGEGVTTVAAAWLGDAPGKEDGAFTSW